MATSSGTLDDQLKRFLLVETPEEFLKDDTELKAGSYGFVYEVRLGGVLRIAKKLHKVFFEASQKEKENVVEKFKKECLTLNKLRHPNVVQFIGVYYGKRGKDDIALVMEKLECDLAGFLSDNSNIELSTKVSILHDVSYGLVYLHEYNPPIIHRDLTAHNILLDKRLRAKIADVGMAKVMDKEVIKAAKYTKAPGQLFYMPPEAKFSKPSYSDKLDIFSFGHLCLHTVLEDYPEVCELTFAEAKRHEGLIEKHKRQRAFDTIGSNHILCSIIVRCLHDNPEARPNSRQLNELVTSLMDKESLMTVEDFKREKLQMEYMETQFKKARETWKMKQSEYENEILALTDQMEFLQAKVEELTLCIDQGRKESDAKLTVTEGRLLKERQKHEQTLKELNQVTELMQCSKQEFNSRLADANAIHEELKLKLNLSVVPADKSSIEDELKLLQEEMHAKKSQYEYEKNAAEIKIGKLCEYIDQLQQAVGILESEMDVLKEDTIKMKLSFQDGNQKLILVQQDLEIQLEESKKHYGKEKQQLTTKLKSLDLLRRTMKSQLDEEKRDLVAKDQVINQNQKELQFFRDRLQSMEYTNFQYESDIRNLNIHKVKLEREIDQLLSQTMGGGDHTEDYIRVCQEKDEIEQQRADYEVKYSTLMDDYKELRQCAIQNGLKVPQRRMEDTSQYQNPSAHTDPYVLPFNPEAVNIEEKVIDSSLESMDDARPLDSNLICPLCGKQYRIGQIQNYKRHVHDCTNKPK